MQFHIEFTCDIVTCNKKYRFHFLPMSGTEFLKPLDFPKHSERSRCLLFCEGGGFWKAPGYPEDGRWLPGDPTHILEGWKFWPHSRPLGRAEGLEIKFCHKWLVISSIMPMKWSLYNNLKRQDSESFLAGKLVGIWRKWGSQRGQGRSSPLPHTSSLYLFHLAIPELYPFIINC